MKKLFKHPSVRQNNFSYIVEIFFLHLFYSSCKENMSNLNTRWKKIIFFKTFTRRHTLCVCIFHRVCTMKVQNIKCVRKAVCIVEKITIHRLGKIFSGEMKNFLSLHKIYRWSILSIIFLHDKKNYLINICRIL